MNVQLVYRHLIAPGKSQLAIRTSSNPFRRELHSRTAISSNLQFSDRLARTPGPALRRTISSSSFDPNAPKSGIRNGTLFSVMMAIGALGIGYGIYEMYAIMGMWPKEVRNDLRVAVRAKQKEDWRTAASYFERAYGTAIALPDPPASFGADYIIKISAIALSLADVLESAGELPKAYSVYGSAFADLTHGLPSPSESSTSLEADQRTRAIGTALKMAELGEQILHVRALGRAPADSDYGPADEAEVEEKLDWALTEALRLRSASAKSTDKGKEKENDTLNLPRWVEGVDLTSTMERVADYYSRKGKVEYAVPLYVHAISTLLPPPNATTSGLFSSTPSPSIGDRCKAATLMNNLSSLFASMTPVNVPQATSWAQKALEVAQKAEGESKSASEERLECQTVIAVVLFNLGMLNELSNEHGKAQSHYEHALEMSKAIGMNEGVTEAQEALRRLKSQPRRP
ncbi:hypothetical protein M407DRAFT_33591 [Tulasnella calospora MUT 4182]|uniref:MalT-like TPR region domain-containing protein n=1 Tax=Tulasnella calospora MUT 4182 TaxID=1051891 RepID=A0A0C3Q2R4_9AGAM|nr:hypothetical protein M407DRAFT_33591 [Tulasnella calospora MUT 4182]